MKLGIKIAPGNTWKKDIEATHPDMVEVWYNASRPDDYNDMFTYLTRQNIDIGLHFWGVDPNGILAGSDSALLTTTIDKASQYSCVYVNIHPDLCAPLFIDFDSMAIRVAGTPEPISIVQSRFIKNCVHLNTYARLKGVLLTVETVPQRDTPSWLPDRDRSQVMSINQLPIDTHFTLSEQGVFIANDICHTACNLITNDRDTIWQFVKHTTQVLAPMTKLIHLGFVVPPYNGVDFHDALDNPKFETSESIPNKKEMIELLKIFTNREDVYLLVEPNGNHVKNFFLARDLLSQI